MTPEGAIQKAITDWLSTVPGVWFYKVHAKKPGKNGAQKTGIPDLCVIHKGRCVWLELKTPTGKLTDSQKREIPLMESAGAIVRIIRSLEELKAVWADLERVAR